VVDDKDDGDAFLSESNEEGLTGVIVVVDAYFCCGRDLIVDGDVVLLLFTAPALPSPLNILLLLLMDRSVVVVVVLVVELSDEDALRK